MSKFNIGDRVGTKDKKWYKEGNVVEIGQPGNPTRTRVKWDNGIRTWFKPEALDKV